jgi:hypothetical protein
MGMLFEEDAVARALRLNVGRADRVARAVQWLVNNA